MRHTQPKASPGFSLFEVILAISVAGLILTAAMSLLVAMTTNWVLRDDRSFFEAHVGGVTLFLTKTMATGGLSTQAATENQQNGGNQQNPGNRGPGADAANTLAGAPSWTNLPGDSSFDDPLIGFTLASKPALLVTELPADQQIEAYLEFSEETGLSLLWTSALRSDPVERKDDLIRAILSPYVRRVQYIHFDPDLRNWETLDEAPTGDDGQPILPRFLKLTFEKDDVVLERFVPIPTPSTELPLF